MASISVIMACKGAAGLIRVTTSFGNCFHDVLALREGVTFMKRGGGVGYVASWAFVPGLDLIFLSASLRPLR